LVNLLTDIEARGGNVRIDALLKGHGMTGRSLERYFEQQIGITPKELIDLTRFKHALAIVERCRERRSLMEIAWECGYYDNAHLTRQFKRFMGEAPSRIILSDLSKSAAG
jgi:transcriptional regulator GlxA family with amidase domain